MRIGRYSGLNDRSVGRIARSEVPVTVRNGIHSELEHGYFTVEHFVGGRHPVGTDQDPTVFRAARR
ncbi:MAG: hypothetical protein KA791_06490, partial [Flavobacteriales bacterium]|nr:hypothetical protein [Flavobacteriales bacterium]